MTQNKKKADIIREHLADIQSIRNSGGSYEKINSFLKEKTGLAFSVGQIHRIMKKAELDGTINKEGGIVLSISPERLQILQNTGVVHITHNGVSYTLESRKYCCKRLQKYARYRGKLVIHFKVCPFCGAKR
jgi:hypothetical protein